MQSHHNGYDQNTKQRNKLVLPGLDSLPNLRYEELFYLSDHPPPHCAAELIAELSPSTQEAKGDPERL